MRRLCRGLPLSSGRRPGGTGWKLLMQGSTFDPVHDQQAQKATTDLVGDNTHGVLYFQFDDKGTATEADDA